MTGSPLPQRWRALVDRTGALVLDTVLIAYALWCLHYFSGGSGAGFGLLDRWPRLLAMAPFLAVLWQATAGSLGMAGYRVALLDAGGNPAGRDARSWWGLLAMGQLAVVVAPWFLVHDAWQAFGPSAAIASVFGVIALVRGSMLERLAGVALARPDGERHGAVTPWYRRFNAWAVLALLGLTFGVGIGVAEIEPGKLLSGWDQARGLWAQLFDPDWSITDKVITAMIQTVFLALMASTLALPFAVLISFLGARNLTQGSVVGRVAYALTRALMNITRSIEPLVWAIIFTFWVEVGPFAGMLALFVHSVAALGKLYSEAIESIDPGPVEAIRATGARFGQVLRYGVVPQVVPAFLSFTVYRWDINVRMATILGLVGGGGIGDLLMNYQQMAIWPKVGTIIVFITAVVWLLDLASARARERLN